ncbi:LysR substrate-binding domain-containing protein [Undibacterium sp. TS12]|uniref:LysR substrate-binding domain-containing protein n=1 Tax=Undibacterium sp. TS12 TaxID=2908202 RepID=UPI001F4C890D|nr:LysR substrate-binding domain-containing protein [Undibacterium sp. TS12]MCH8623018.1 LysR substrate-binding domain-containing protein [Undibacterium sp. TS12]
MRANLSINQPLLEDLELFCVVVRRSSFAASALELGVSNALVSKRIAILEKTLQVRLLHRTTRKVWLTDHGHVVHQWAQRILADVDQLAEAISQKGSSPRGLLRLCTSSGFGRNRIAPAISALVRKYPELEVQLELLDRPVDLIAEGFHLDIRIGQVQESHLIARRIAENERILCASPAYLKRHGKPRQLSDLSQHQCIVIRERDQEPGRWNLHGPHGPETIKIKGSLSANNGELVHQWAIEGHGIILRSIWDVGHSLAEGRLVRVLPLYSQKADVWAIYPTRLETVANVRVCVQFLEKWLLK